LAAPALPAVLPRWDDVAMAVLWLAERQNGLGWRQMDGSPAQGRQGGYVIRRLDAPPPTPPNIAAGPGSGPALASAPVLDLLGVLGLLEEGRWTAAAEGVLWRGLPREWGLPFDGDPRVLAAVEQALATLPDGIRAEMARMVRITEADLAEAMARHETSQADLRERFGPKARTGPMLTKAGARHGLVFRRQNELDWLFFRNWRLAGGWLSARDPVPRLEIFHDRLAIHVRQAVVGRLHPGEAVAGSAMAG